MTPSGSSYILQLGTPLSSAVPRAGATTAPVAPASTSERLGIADAPCSRRRVPHLRCGICDQEFESGAETIYVDDERVHRECAEDGVR